MEININNKNIDKYIKQLKAIKNRNDAINFAKGSNRITKSKGDTAKQLSNLLDDFIVLKNEFGALLENTSLFFENAKNTYNQSDNESSSAFKG